MILDALRVVKEEGTANGRRRTPMFGLWSSGSEGAATIAELWKEVELSVALLRRSAVRQKGRRKKGTGVFPAACSQEKDSRPLLSVVVPFYLPTPAAERPGRTYGSLRLAVGRLVD